MNELIASTRETQEIQDGALTLLIGGRDTTASLLNWIFFFFARQPRVFESLRCEILAKFGSVAVSCEINYPMLKSLPYLQSVINETLRLRAIVAMTNRVCAQDTVLPSGGTVDGLVGTTFPSVEARGFAWDVSLFSKERKGRRA